jgi:hypothetical protein
MTRPIIYTDDLATRICVRIANGGRLDEVAMLHDMPDLTTVTGWLSGGKHRTFEDMFCWAQEHRDNWDYAVERWGPYPRTPVTLTCVPTLFQRFRMKPVGTRQFQYVDTGADLEREIRLRRFSRTALIGGDA